MSKVLRDRALPCWKRETIFKELPKGLITYKGWGEGLAEAV